MQGFFSPIITAHLFLVKVVPNLAAPLFQITQNQSHGFSHHPLSFEMWKAVKSQQVCHLLTVCSLFSCPIFLSPPFQLCFFFWNSGRGTERRWRIVLKIILRFFYSFLWTQSMGDTCHLGLFSSCTWILLDKTAKTYPV